MSPLPPSSKKDLQRLTLVGSEISWGIFYFFMHLGFSGKQLLTGFHSSFFTGVEKFDDFYTFFIEISRSSMIIQVVDLPQMIFKSNPDAGNLSNGIIGIQIGT